jgi:hypothetical protein
MCPRTPLGYFNADQSISTFYRWLLYNAAALFSESEFTVEWQNKHELTKMKYRINRFEIRIKINGTRINKNDLENAEEYV